MKSVATTIIVLIIILGLATGRPVTAAERASLSVTVVGADNSDPRWHAVEEAVEFWNQQLAAAGIDVRLGPIARLIQPVSDDALSRISTALVGRYRFEPDVPEGLRQIPGDIIVALSTAELISFGLPWRPEQSGLVGLRRADIPPLSLPNVPRNLVAHELGHVLGLRHNSDPATLMCGRPAPCRPSAFASERAQFFLLISLDIATLRSRWHSSTR